MLKDAQDFLTRTLLRVRRNQRVTKKLVYRSMATAIEFAIGFAPTRTIHGPKLKGERAYGFHHEIHPYGMI